MKPSKEELRNLLKSNSNEETSKKLNVSIRTIQRWRDSYGLSHEIVHIGDHKLTEHQAELLTAWMLGDGSIEYIKNKTQKTRFILKQKSERREYVKFAFNELLPYSSKFSDDNPRNGPVRINGKAVHNNCGPTLYSSFTYTRCCSIFNELRKAWYTEPYNKFSQKIVPDFKMNWKIFSYWFADDGNNSAARRSVILCTNCFLKNDVEKLITIIKRDLNIDSHMLNTRSGPIIVIGAEFYDFVVEQLRSNLKHLECLNSKIYANYVHNYLDYTSSLSNEVIEQLWEDKKNLISVPELCKKYKLSKATLFRIVKKKSLENNEPYPGEFKFTKNDIEYIIKEWNDGAMQKEIAIKYGVSQRLISQIVTKKIYKNYSENVFVRKSKWSNT